MSYWDRVDEKTLVYTGYGNMVDVTPMTEELDIPGSVYVCCNLWRDKLHASYINADYLFLSLLKVIFRGVEILNVANFLNTKIRVIREEKQIFILQY